MAKGRKSLTEAADRELKTAFSLDKFKANKGLASNVKFKEQKWIPFSPALQEALSIPGIPMGHNSMVRGKSNTGKSTMTIEVAVNAQKMGVLPVLIITEMKHDWKGGRRVAKCLLNKVKTIQCGTQEPLQLNSGTLLINRL
jgi:RecA/RadA recombinase